MPHQRAGRSRALAARRCRNGSCISSECSRAWPARISRTMGRAAAISADAHCFVNGGDTERRLESTRGVNRDAFERDEVRRPDEDGDVECAVRRAADTRARRRGLNRSGPHAARRSRGHAPPRARRRAPRPGIRPRRPPARLGVPGIPAASNRSALRITARRARLRMLAFAMPARNSLETRSRESPSSPTSSSNATEIDLFARQLGDILAHADEVQQIDTTGVPPTANVVTRQAADRADELRSCLDRRGRAGQRARRRRSTQASSRCRGSSDDATARPSATFGTASARGARSRADVCRDALGAPRARRAVAPRVQHGRRATKR